MQDRKNKVHHPLYNLCVWIIPLAFWQVLKRPSWASDHIFPQFQEKFGEFRDNLQLRQTQSKVRGFGDNRSPLWLINLHIMTTLEGLEIISIFAKLCLHSSLATSGVISNIHNLFPQTYGEVWRDWR